MIMIEGKGKNTVGKWSGVDEGEGARDWFSKMQASLI